MATVEEIREQVRVVYWPTESAAAFYPQNVIVRAPEHNDVEGRTAVRLTYSLDERAIGWRDYWSADLASSERRGLVQALEGVGDVEAAYVLLREFHDLGAMGRS